MVADLGSPWIRTAMYGVAALACVLAARRERQVVRRDPKSSLAPTIWILTAGLFIVMMLGRVGDIGGLLADVGRHEARDEGWYDTRRSLQAAVIGMFALVWAVTVVALIWKTPERRRRYLPMALVVSTLVAFAAIRVVSLHQIDAVLYRTDIEGLEVGALIELVVLAIAISIAGAIRDPSPHSCRPTGSCSRPLAPRMIVIQS